ncbi:hypothetical protein P8452_09650 [Trifolium repens]|nr:hypothetical protein P8452_09650 [Trifolium repens]
MEQFSSLSLSFSTIKQTNPLSQFPTKTKLQPHFSLLGSSNPTPKPCILIHAHLASPTHNQGLNSQACLWN